MTKRAAVEFMLTIMILLALAPTGSADSPALSFTSYGASSSLTNWTMGWEFTTNTHLSVTALGAFDLDGDGLALPHDVGIWRVSDQQLLMSLTVAGGTAGTLIDGFRRWRNLDYRE